MKRLLFALALLCALSLQAPAQQRSVELRQGDALRGPVRSARVEYATISRADGAHVEGARRLISVSTYAPDGKRRERQSYAPDGAPRDRHVYVYDDDGREVEMSVFDGGGKLLERKVSRPSAGESLTYDGEGELRSRRVTVIGPDGKLDEVLTYDGGGALVERAVRERREKISVWSTYRADGSLKQRDEHTLDYGGPHQTKTKTYAPDGSVVGSRISNVDAGVTDLRATEARAGGGPPRRTRETREYDSRQNLSRMVTYRLNDETGEYEPAAVSYYVIEYYR